MVTEALGHRHEDRFGTVWHMANRDMVTAAELVSQVAAAPPGSILPAGVDILRQQQRRQVLRVTPREADRTAFVAKIFRLSSFYRRVHHQFAGYNRFALGEAVNLITARRRGLDVPRVYGYGYARDRLGIIKADLVIMENLTSCVPVGELFERHAGNRDACEDILNRVSRIFTALYGAGCNHIDVNPGAILLDRNDWTKAFLLDLEHATFHHMPSLEILAFEAAYFSESCRRWVSENMIDRWFARLAEMIGVTDAAGVRMLTDRFRHYLNRAMSRSERKKIC